MIMAAKFWKLASPESTRKLAEWKGDEMDLQGIICPRTNDHQRAGKRLTHLSILLRGAPVDDFVWTWYSECLIQEHVFRLFKKHKVTGFQLYKAKASFKDEREEKPPTLGELIVTGWGGIASPKSGVRLKEHCSACGFLTYSGFDNPEKLIDDSQWDGSDIFMVWPLPRFVFVTERVANILRDADLKGFRLRSLSELGTADGISPGRLSYSMPEARARELGEPLGIY